LTLDEVRECRTSTLQSDVAIGRVIDVEDAARRLRVPTLILCGGHDELTPPALSQRLGALIAGSRVEIVPSAGHMLPLEAPEAVNRAIVSFLGPLASAGPRPAPAPSRRYALRFVVQRLVGRLWRSAPGT
jgi:alpha-beta hydrolase superfamily lysophospholipase